MAKVAVSIDNPLVRVKESHGTIFSMSSSWCPRAGITEELLNSKILHPKLGIAGFDTQALDNAG